MKTRIASALLASITLNSGCATYTTLSSSDREVARDLAESRSRCGVVPRVYSGTVYRFCTLNSEPGNHQGHENELIPYALDGLLSCVADTLVLPYTIYLQAERGSNQL